MSPPISFPDSSTESSLPSSPLPDSRSAVTAASLIHSYVLPTIFCLGIAGNIVNLLLLGNRQVYGERRSSNLERSAVAGLRSLAASDLLFCLVGVTWSFLEALSAELRSSDGYAAVVVFYLSKHKTGVINIFLFISTWLIVLISVERYIAVCHPFEAQRIIRYHRTIAAQIVVFIVGILVNIPLFLRFTIERDDCGDNLLPPSSSSSSVSSSTNESSVHTTTSSPVCYYPIPSYFFTRPSVGLLHNLVWSVVGTFVPLCLMVVTNICIVRTLYAARRARAVVAPVTLISAQPLKNEKSMTLRLTLTLNAIVLCFLILVCPSMLIQFAIFARTGSGRALGPAYETALLVTNLTQAIKFSMNFVLYCGIIQTFRHVFGRFLRDSVSYCLRRGTVAGAASAGTTAAAVAAGGAAGFAIHRAAAATVCYHPTNGCSTSSSRSNNLTNCSSTMGGVGSGKAGTQDGRTNTGIAVLAVPQIVVSDEMFEDESPRGHFGSMGIDNDMFEQNGVID